MRTCGGPILPCHSHRTQQRRQARRANHKRMEFNRLMTSKIALKLWDSKKGAEAPFHPNNLLVPNRTACANASDLLMHLANLKESGV